MADSECARESVARGAQRCSTRGEGANGNALSRLANFSPNNHHRQYYFFSDREYVYRFLKGKEK